MCAGRCMLPWRMHVTLKVACIFLHHIRDNDRAESVARDVERRAPHVKNPVDARDQRDAFDRFGGLLAQQDDGESDQQSHDNDLKHVGFCDRRQEVGREDADNHIHRLGRFRRFIGEAAGREDRVESLEHVGKKETNRSRHRSRRR